VVQLRRSCRRSANDTGAVPRVKGTRLLLPVSSYCFRHRLIVRYLLGRPLQQLDPLLGTQVAVPGSIFAISAFMDKTDLAQVTSKGESVHEETILATQPDSTVARTQRTFLGGAHE
jgi:hypothetical protein